MNQEKRRHGWRATGALMMSAALLLSACSGIGGSSSEPTVVTITAPAPNTEVKVGQSVAIEGSAKGGAIVRVDILIDGALYAQIPGGSDTGVPEIPVDKVPWTPTAAGQHTIVITAVGPKADANADEKVIGRSETLIINAQAAAVPATPTAQPTVGPVPTAAAPIVATTPPSGTNNTAPDAGGSGDAPSLTVTNEFVNVRTGPGIGYDKLGELKLNEKAPVRGRSADNGWYQVAFQNGLGWVIADYVQPNAGAKSVAVAQAPAPPPVVQQPIAPAAPAPAVNTQLVPLAPVAAVPVAPAPVAPVPVASQPTAGSRGVLRVASNPVTAGSNVVATWNIPNFKEGSFDKGDGRGFIPPVSSVMNVNVENVTSQRTISLKWKDNNGVEQVDSLTLFIVGQAAGVPAPVNTANCDSGNPDWRARDYAEWQFCVRPGGDMEYVTSGLSPTQNFNAGEDRNITVKWNVYGINGVFFTVERNDQKCGPAGGINGVNEPVGGDGTFTFNINKLATGGYKMSMKIIRKDGVEVRFGEKFLCVGVGGSSGGGGGGGGGGGNPAPGPGATAAP